jgi:23S rRNA (guanosine2251-2'-O)-methyltransferase
MGGTDMSPSARGRPGKRAAAQTKKKGPSTGTGGHGRKKLTGRKPTPRAEDRTNHPAARRAESIQRREEVARQRARKAADAPELLLGRNPVLEALRAKIPALALIITTGMDVDDRVNESIRTAADRGIALQEIGRPELDRMTHGALHQGIALQVPPYAYAHPDDLLVHAQHSGRPALIVALDGVTDPRNLGAIVRSAAAFGAHGVVVPQRRSVGMTASAWRTSAGAAARVPVARAVNLGRALASYQKAGLTTVGLDASGEHDIDDLDLADQPLVLVLGGEGSGLTRLVRAGCDYVARIPITSDTESLNVSVAAGIALAGIARARR